MTPKSSVMLAGTPEVVRRSSLGHMPEGAWKFDQSVTEVFDDMLARSIPHIGLMRDTVFLFATRFAQRGTHVLDLGCSRGEAMASIIERFGSANRFLALDISEPMVAACQERFAAHIQAGTVEVRCADLRGEYPTVDASVTLCILTLMFTPIEHRFRILSDAFAHTLPTHQEPASCAQRHHPQGANQAPEELA